MVREMADTAGGIGISWGAEHRNKNGLIVRMVSISPPHAPTCLKLSCLWRHYKESLLFAFVSNYHARRVAYAEANKGKEILERYRTGKPSPQTIWQAIHANLKLKCPVCRKYNVDPLLFRR